MLGSPVDLSTVDVDSYVVAGIADHLCPWQSCYRSTQLLGGDVRFVLSTSGHIASMVNPPGNPKATFQVAPAAADPADPPDPRDWLQAAETVQGSWWPDYSAWLAERSGGEQDRPGPPGRQGIRAAGARARPATSSTGSRPVPSLAAASAALTPRDRDRCRSFPAARPPTTRSIVVDGQQLRVDGPARDRPALPLLLVNGIGASLELLQPFVDALDPAARGHPFRRPRGRRLAAARPALPLHRPVPADGAPARPSSATTRPTCSASPGAAGSPSTSPCSSGTAAGAWCWSPRRPAR